MHTQKRNSIYVYYHNKKKRVLLFIYIHNKTKKKKIDYSKCYYLLETLYIHIEENSLISNQKKKKKKRERKKNLSQINIISMHY